MHAFVKEVEGKWGFCVCVCVGNLRILRGNDPLVGLVRSEMPKIDVL